MQPMRILLVDDHTLFRRALASLLSSRPGIEVVAEAGDGLEALAREVAVLRRMAEEAPPSELRERLFKMVRAHS